LDDDWNITGENTRDEQNEGVALVSGVKALSVQL